MPGHPSSHALPRLAFSVALALVAAAALGAVPRPAHASDAAGVYSLVEDVALETDPTRPDVPLRIRIHGVHALSYRPESGGQRGRGIYTEPAAGYLYFACDPADADLCRLEWQDLRKAVGDERCAAYGDRYLSDPEPNGRLRPADEAPSGPDRYPIGRGVLLTRQGDVNTCADLRAFAAGRGTPPATPGTPPPTDSPTAPPTDVPVASAVPPEVKVSPTPGSAPQGGLLLPGLSVDVAAGTTMAPQGHNPAAEAVARGFGPAAAPRSAPRPAPLPFAVLALTVLGAMVAGTRGRRKPR